MHIVYIGVVAKFILFYLAVTYDCQKLSVREIQILDRRMDLLSSYCPSYFNRRPSSISLYDHSKVTEYRQCLLYYYPAVFENVLPYEKCIHFMISHFVIRILNEDPVLPTSETFCQTEIEDFLKLTGDYCGDQVLSYNLHGLLHLVDDVKNMVFSIRSVRFATKIPCRDFGTFKENPHKT